MKIERTKSGNFLLKVKKQEILLDGNEFEQLYEEVRKCRYEKRLLEELESTRYDAKAIAGNGTLMSELVEAYAQIAENDDGFDAESEIAYEIINDFEADLEPYRKEI